MGIESRQGPIYFYAPTNESYRKNMEKIFGKKEKTEAMKPKKTTKAKPAKKAAKVKAKAKTKTTTGKTKGRPKGSKNKPKVAAPATVETPTPTV